MDVEIKIDSLDDMCDDNYLDSKQDDIEVKIKNLNSRRRTYEGSRG